MPDTLHINMLGEFSITYRGRTLNDSRNRSKKLWTLLAYLITFREREISQNELIELLWPEDEIENPANTLKTLLHRVRLLVSELEVDDARKIIAYRGGTYAWAPTVDCIVDVSNFEKTLSEAYRPGTQLERKIELLLKAAALYKGDFLPKNALESWVMPINAYYRAQYVKLVGELVTLLNEQERFEELVSVCRRAVVVDPYEESLHLSLMKGLMSLGRQKQAMAHYEYVRDLFFRQFGINLSPELVSIYKDIVHASHTTEHDLSVIAEGLKETDRAHGSFYCEYAFFKTIYQLEARTAARTGHVVYIGLLTVSDPEDGPLPSKQVNNLMDKLRDIISFSLRKGDVFSRYSVTQYLVMLPTASFENSETVMSRITRAFKRENPKTRAVLRFSVQPLMPAELE